MVIGVSDPQRVLELVVLQNAILASLTIGLFWLGVFVARRFGRSSSYSLSPLGFSRPRAGVFAGAGIGLLVGIGALMISIPLNLASAAVLERFGYSTQSTVQGPFMEGLREWVQQSPILAIPAIVLVVVILGPAVEELTFRGGVFNALYHLGRLASKGNENKRFVSTVEKVSFAAAALVSSAVFALLHLEPVLLPALLILAVVLCVLFRRTGSLLPCFVAHATFNSFATLLIILSGLGVFQVPV
ncbi:MAG TPA: CPBP family intramembrane glutamic endopeptidase [Rubrobacteraceae bacterium]|nr:CPBP family intramembrane glutamic endopeptidase [Rubrobacteraceae bacterium]